MVRCGQCHHQNERGTVDCARCGSILTEGEPATTATAFGFRSPLAAENDASSASSSEIRPARTSYGIHVLDEDGVFDPGQLHVGSDHGPASAETVHGLKLSQTMGLPAQRDAADSPAAPRDDGDAGSTAFGIRAASLQLPGPAGPGQPVAAQTLVGGLGALDDPNATMVGLSAITDQVAVPPGDLLGDLSDTWVDQMFDHVSKPGASLGSVVSEFSAAAPGTPAAQAVVPAPFAPQAAVEPQPTSAPAPEAKLLPALVRPGTPPSSSIAPGFGIVRKKKTRKSSSTQQNRAVASAGSYENQRAEPERPNVSATGRMARLPDPTADSTPVARIATPVSATPAAPQPAPVPVSGAKQLGFGDTLAFDFGDLAGGGAASNATQILSATTPRDRLSPISVKSASGDSLKPLPVSGGSLPKPAVQTPATGAPVVAESRAYLQTAGFSPEAMVGSELIGAPRVSSGDALTLPPGGLGLDQQPAQDAIAVDQTIAFSPSMDLSNIESRGITPPSGAEALQLDDGGMHRFLDEQPQATASQIPAPEPVLTPPRPPASHSPDGADLFSVAQRAGLVDSEELSISRWTPRADGTPRHLTDANRNSSDVVRRITLVAVVVLLPVALSFLGVLLYQEFTTGTSTDAPNVEEGSGL